MKTTCERCTEKQKSYTLKVIKRLKKEYPTVWKQLQDHWDPTGTYVKKFEASFINVTEEPEPSQVIHIGDRFDLSDSSKSSTYAPIPTSSTTLTSTSQYTTSKHVNNAAPDATTESPNKKPSTTSQPVSNKIGSGTMSSVSSTADKVNVLITFKSNSNANRKNNSSTTYTYTRQPLLPFTNTIGESIKATVDLGTNIVDNVVRTIGTIGSRIIEEGSHVAEVVIKTLSPPPL